MLKILRKKGVAKKIIWVIAVIIIISFGFLGTAYLLTGNSDSYAGRIFGKKISLQEYDRIYQHIRIQAIMRFGDKFNEVRQFLNLDADTWDRIILLHEANKRRIKIKNEEIVKTIESYGFFQRDGQFDTLLYNDILRFVFRVKPREFEESIRDTLKLAKLLDLEATDIDIDENVIKEAFNTQNEKVQISYVLIAPEKFTKDISIPEEQVSAYYENHKEEFRTPPMTNVEYIQLDVPPDTDTPEDSPENTNELENTDTLTREEKLQQAREKAQTIYEQLAVNPDIHAAAKEHNLTVQSSGLFSLEQPNLSLGWSFEIIKDIFELQPNQIAGPFETPNGIQLIVGKEKKDAYIPPLEEAKFQVLEAILKEESRKIAQQKGQEYLKLIKEEVAKTELKDFTQAAKNLNLEIAQTPLFIRGQYLPKIGISKEFQDTAFALTEDNNLSDVIEITNGFCILHLDSYLAADENQYAEQREEIKTKLLEEKKNTRFNDFLTRLRIRANLEDNISKLQESN
ncbi:MAG: peptidyl-prolyl cis-trans isomerase [Candidatus Omnitrophica bacterium]|nr:peptidyl-prolyl cis-trans isomerase [Candidatus Omnitrophota bacterium]MCB9747615.1 peptidyl-prolyl cis-trans isomerase [Candidatus Omnitrophota bacterium]